MLTKHILKRTFRYIKKQIINLLIGLLKMLFGMHNFKILILLMNHARFLLKHSYILLKFVFQPNRLLCD